MILILIAWFVSPAKTAPVHIRAAVEAWEAGKAAETKGQIDSAINCFEQAIRIEPTYREARKAIIQINLDAGHKLEAAKALTELLQIEPEEVSERIQLGTLLLQLQEKERALAQFSSALRAVPKNADALFGFAQAAAQMGMTDRAKEAVDRGRQLYPADRRFSNSILAKPIN